MAPVFNHFKSKEGKLIHSITTKKASSRKAWAKGICLAFIAFMLVSLSLGAVFTEDVVVPIESRDTLFSIDLNDVKVGCAVGNKGLILRTEDNGRTWERIQQVTKVPLNDVIFVEDSGWIVGQKGVILHSRDGGKSWHLQKSNTEESLLSVYFFDLKKGVAVGKAGIILNTDDGGETWTLNSFDLLNALPESLIENGVYSIILYDAFFLENGMGWIVGDNGSVLFSADGGKQWEFLRVGLYAPLYTVFFKNEQIGFAAGQNGILISTEDGGKSWKTITTHTTQNLYKVCMCEDAGIVTGENGTVLESNNGGKTWYLKEMSLPFPLPSFLDASIIGPTSSQKMVLLMGEALIKCVHID